MKNHQKDWGKDKYYFFYSEKQYNVTGRFNKYKGEPYTECCKVGSGKWSAWDDAKLVVIGEFKSTNIDFHSKAAPDPVAWWKGAHPGINFGSVLTGMRAGKQNSYYHMQYESIKRQIENSMAVMYPSMYPKPKEAWYKKAEKEVMEQLKADMAAHWQAEFNRTHELIMARSKRMEEDEAHAKRMKPAIDYKARYKTLLTKMNDYIDSLIHQSDNPKFYSMTYEVLTGKLRNFKLFLDEESKRD